MDVYQFLREFRRDEFNELLCQEIEEMNQRDVASEPLMDYARRILGENEVVQQTTERIREEVREWMGQHA